VVWIRDPTRNDERWESGVRTRNGGPARTGDRRNRVLAPEANIRRLAEPNMRDYVILTVVILGGFWAFDIYKFDGRHTANIWQQATDAGRDFSRAVQGALDRAMSSR
jgi:hypothetical protein